MSLCRYDTSKPCENHGTSSRTCLDCILGKIRAEIDGAELPKNRMSFFRDGINCALQIIDKHRKEIVNDTMSEMRQGDEIRH